jgi:hypothetical protein
MHGPLAPSCLVPWRDIHIANSQSLAATLILNIRFCVRHRNTMFAKVSRHGFAPNRIFLNRRAHA